MTKIFLAFVAAALLSTAIGMHRECRRKECRGRDYASREDCPLMSHSETPELVDVRINYVLECRPGQLFVHFLKIYQEDREHEKLIAKRAEVIRHSTARVGLDFQNVFKATTEFYGLHLIIDHNCTPDREFTKKRIDLLGCCWTSQSCNFTASLNLERSRKNNIWFQDSFQKELDALEDYSTS